MGKKKKKRDGGGRKGKGRPPSKDLSSPDDGDLLHEELTALSAIFQDDFKVLSPPPLAHFIVNLRPHTDDAGNEHPGIVALLSVRTSPGYPCKCPKLQVEPAGDGLRLEDVEQLASLLHDQAASNAREGRVMIFNLVEAAQEYLSEILPSSRRGKEELLLGAPSVLSSEVDCSEGLLVYGLYDLFGDLGSFQQSFMADANNKTGRNFPPTVTGSGSTTMDNFKFKQREKLASALAFKPTNVGIKNNIRLQVASKLNDLDEENDDDCQSLSTTKESTSSSGVSSSGKDSREVEGGVQTKKHTVFDQGPHDSEETLLDSQGMDDGETHAEKNDMLMAYLLRLACLTKGSLASALPDISRELYNLGMLSGRARDLAAESPVNFNKIFTQHFEQHMISSHVAHFWRGSFDSAEVNTSPLNSRYLNDFEEIRSIGHGGFGHVVLCQNKLDGRQYAVKKIRLKSKSSPFNEKILREVATLSRLQHQHVVRYYQAWFETQFDFDRENTCGSAAGESFSSYLGTTITSDAGIQVRQECTYLYIQMEYCPRTLHQDFGVSKRFVDKDLTWHLFRQIVEGLAHIHAQGIIHRDLTPNNIFFDARNDIKIGDFGLAKFLKLEQLDPDHVLPNDTSGISADGTGQVGTYYYTAPEIEQAWPQINEKVDMYSLGVVFFELWHPFDTAMERHLVLSDLKLKGSLPSVWVAEFPEQASLVQQLMSPNPSDRPSAKELLRHSLPPRMEDEWLNDILRTIQTAEDSYIYDQVISTIFDEDRIKMKAQKQHSEGAKLSRNEASSMQHTEADIELRDITIDIANDVYKTHGAKRLEISPMRLIDNDHQFNRRSIKVLSSGGELLELCHELRSPFVSWIISNERTSFKRYEISWVHRKAIGHSIPNRCLQGDFDIIGGMPAITLVEAIKVALDILSYFFQSNCFDIRLNHGKILAAMWSWIGIEGALKQDVANVLSSLSLYPPQSSERKGHWTFIRRQLLQGINLSKSVVDRLQTVDSRFCGSVEQSLARLRGAVSHDKLTRNAFDEISMLLSCLRSWRIEKNISIDVLMLPEENYYGGLFFQIYLVSGSSIGMALERNLFAIGGSYDQLLHTLWDHKSTAPSAVGVSLALEKILHIHSVDIKPSSWCRHELNNSIVLVCSRGGGGLLEERMDLVAELWQANIKADFVPLPVCSLTMQYDYAAEHDIRLLIIITEAGLSQTGLVEVRNLELKRDKKIERGLLVQFVSKAVSTQFRSLSIWN